MNLGLGLSLVMPRLPFTPAQLGLSGWWRASYPGTAPWVDQIASRNLGLGVEPGAGTAVNGFNPASFNGSTELLQAADNLTNYITRTAYSFIILCKPTAANAPASPDPRIMGDSAGVFSMTYSTSGVSWVHTDSGGVARTAGPVACSVNNWHAIGAFYDGTNATLNVDGTTSSVATAQLFNLLTGFLRIARGAASTTTFQAEDVLEVLVASSNLSAQYDTVKAYFNARYGLSI